MGTYTLPELVSLHLSTHAGDEYRDHTACTASGISDALGVSKTMSERIELLSTLSEMEESGLIDERRATAADDREGERNVYRLTDRGDRLAAVVRERLDGTTVRVRNGDDLEIPLAEADEYVPEPSLAGVLTRVDDGVIDLRDTVEGEFVDREDETATLRDCLDTVVEGTGETVLVSGDAGVGKTTLVERLLEHARDHDATVLRGACSPEDEEPYRAFREALRDAATDSGARATVEDPFEDRESLPTDDDPEAVEHGRTLLFYEVREALATLADDGPLVLFIDDVHDADGSTVDLFRYLCETLTEVPVLLVGTYRAGEVAADHPLESVVETVTESGGTLVELEPFDRSVTGDLVEHLLETRSVPSSFVDLVYERTGGNPLFVAENVSQLREEGAVDPDLDVYPTSADEVDTPDRVQEVVAARFRVLDDAARAVLERGSVIGDRIPFALLAAVCDRPEPELREYVDVLVDARVWTVEDETTYGFESTVVREAVLESLDDERERRLHEAVAEAYADRDDGEQGGDRDATIARHFRASGDDERALEYYRRAGDRATDVFAHDLALEYYKTALGLARALDRSDETADLLERVGLVHYYTGDRERAAKYFEFLRERSDDPELHRRTYRYQSEMNTDRGDNEAAVEYAERGLDIDPDAVTEEQAHLHEMRGWTLLFLGEREAAAEAIETALAMAEDLDSDRRRAGAYLRLSGATFLAGDVEGALEYRRRADEAWSAADQSWRRASNLNNLGVMHLRVGDLEDARAAFEESIDLAAEVGHRIQETITRGNYGLCLQRLGEWDAAREQYRSAREAASNLEMPQTVSLADGFRGVIALRRGKLGTATERFDRCLDVALDLRHVRMESMVRNRLARLALLNGDLSGARDHAERVLEIAEGVEPEWMAEANTRLGDVAAVEGRHDDARDRYRTGIDHAERASSARTLVLNRARLAVAQCRDGDPDAGLESAREALDGVSETPNPWLAARVQLALGHCHLAAGDEAAARAALDAALEESRSLGARLLEGEVRREWARLDGDGEGARG